MPKEVREWVGRWGWVEEVAHGDCECPHDEAQLVLVQHRFDHEAVVHRCGPCRACTCRACTCRACTCMQVVVRVGASNAPEHTSTTLWLVRALREYGDVRSRPRPRSRSRPRTRSASAPTTLRRRQRHPAATEREPRAPRSRSPDRFFIYRFILYSCRLYTGHRTAFRLRLYVFATPCASPRSSVSMMHLGSCMI